MVLILDTMILDPDTYAYAILARRIVLTTSRAGFAVIFGIALGVGLCMYSALHVGQY
jgi:hypothetical protein